MSQDQMLKELFAAAAKSGLSDREIATRSGLSNTVMNGWKRGSYPAIDSYCKVAGVLGLHVVVKRPRAKRAGVGG